MGDAEEESALGMTDAVLEMELARADDAELCENGANALTEALNAAGLHDDFDAELAAEDASACRPVRGRRGRAPVPVPAPVPVHVTVAVPVHVPPPAPGGVLRERVVAYRRPKRGKK